MRISCPPTISPCFYGVDTPAKKELVASSHTVEEIRKNIEADSLAYLSLEGLLEGRQRQRRTNSVRPATRVNIRWASPTECRTRSESEQQLDLWEATLNPVP